MSSKVPQPLQAPLSPTISFTSTTLHRSAIRPAPAPLPTHFLTTSDITASFSAYENLSEAAQSYRKALSLVAVTASEFGSALEGCARCKGAGSTADGLMGSGALQFLIASNMHILSESIYRGFEIPLRREVDSYREKNSANKQKYTKEAGDRSCELRKREKQHIKISNTKTRNLTSFRSALVDLTEQVDALESLRYIHYRTAYELSQETADRILDSSALLVRAQIEIFEKIAQKGWDSSGGLDELISRSADPFHATSGSGSNQETEIFTILPTESILPTPQDELSCPDSVPGPSTSTSAEQETNHQSISGAISPLGDEDSHSEIAVRLSNHSLNPATSGYTSSRSSTDWGNSEAVENTNLIGILRESRPDSVQSVRTQPAIAQDVNPDWMPGETQHSE